MMNQVHQKNELRNEIDIKGLWYLFTHNLHPPYPPPWVMGGGGLRHFLGLCRWDLCQIGVLGGN